MAGLRCGQATGTGMIDMTGTMYTCVGLLTMGGVYIAIGAGLSQADALRPLRRPLHLLVAAMAVWFFGMALAAGAARPAMGQLGLRLALGGRLAADCAVLLLLTHTPGLLQLVKKRMFLLAGSLPAAALLLVSVILPFADSGRVAMVHTAFGWAEQPVDDTVYLVLYLAQSAVFAAALLWLTARCFRKRQGALLVGVCVAAVALRTLVWVFTGIASPLRPLSSIFPLFPLITAAICGNRPQSVQEDAGVPAPKLLTHAFRTHIYEMLGVVAVVFAVFNMLSSRTVGDAGETLWRSVSLLAVAGCLLLLNRVRMKSLTRDLILTVALSYVVPIMTFGSQHSGNLTAWAFLFVLLMAGLLFDRVMVPAVTLAVACMSQLALWAYQPVTHMQVDGFAYLVRFAVLAVVAVLAYGVHYVYLRRLKENVSHEKKQRLVADISRSFISVGEDNFDRKIYGALEQCGQFMQADRAFLVLFSQSGRQIGYTCEWLADETIVPAARELGKMFIETEPSGPPTQQPRNITQLRSADGAAREKMREKGIRFLTGMSIRSGQDNIGYMGFTASAAFRRQSTEDNGFLAVVAGMVSDAVLKVEAERRINFIAYHDQLTSLPNRLLFNDRIGQAIALAGRFEKMLAVAFIDLDAFKAVNDTLGHDMGDRLLEQAARTLRENVRGYDTVSRFGGDEFTVLLNQISSMEDLKHIMRKLMDALKCPFSLGGQEVFITASAGVAVYPQDGTDAAALVKSADTAMYHAKEQGKNRFAFCSKDMKDQILDKMKLSNLLYRALEKGQMSLLYQPMVSTAGHTVVGCEALPFWNLPGRGRLGREVFQPLAEQTGLVLEIGAWVLETACAQNRKWHDEGFTRLRMVVGLSIQQLLHPRLTAQVGEILAKTGLEAQYLELEITENAANENTGQIVDAMKRLKQLGVSLSINEFGAEYSSLSRLKLLPIDRIKMDTQFVQGLDKDEKDQTIATVIIGLAKSLDLRVAAEGVDSAPQINFLRSKMCDELQGDYCYSVMTAEEVGEALCKMRGSSLENE